MEISRELNLFGESVPVKNYGCSKNGGPYDEAEDPLSIRLSVCPTHFCGAGCPFCAASSSTGEKGFLDPDKLRQVLLEMHSKKALSGVSITGGEPFTDISLLNEIVDMIFEIFGLETDISINTNGTGLKDLHKIDKYLFIDAIHISRHHYDDNRNRRYFGIDVPTEEELREIVNREKDKRLFVFNCLLLADGIGTKEEAKVYMEFADRVGVPKVGFVTPMAVNPYAEKNRVSYTEVLDRRDPEFLFRKCFKDFEYCHCTDGLYAAKSGRLMHFYGRETAFGTPDYARGLVYTADNILKTGYGKDAKIIKSFE